MKGIVPDLLAFAIVTGIVIINIAKIVKACKSDAEKKQKLAKIKGLFWAFLICAILFFVAEIVFFITEPQLYNRTIACFIGVAGMTLSSRISAKINEERQ